MDADKSQINVRVDAELLDRIDRKRIVLQKELSRIPTRSEVIRMALDEFLGEAPSKKRQAG